MHGLNQKTSSSSSFRVIISTIRFDAPNPLRSSFVNPTTTSTTRSGIKKQLPQKSEYQFNGTFFVAVVVGLEDNELDIGEIGFGFESHEVAQRGRCSTTWSESVTV